ncbi:MAG: type I restriction enzyme HsdR N-terminal domain-containing protein [Desulfonatronovibrio sp.]
MHEVSLNQTIIDYLSGDEIESTTYEDLRQSLARILVEEKNYPPENIKPRFTIDITLDDKKYSIVIDFVIYNEDKPVLILGFCPGAVSTYITQYLCLARIFPDSPVPYLIVTDTNDASLMDVARKKEICRGFHCIPAWEELLELASEAEPPVISPERLEKEKRIAYAMFALSDTCCTAACPADSE